MKKTTLFLLTVLFAFAWQTNAQILNQSANWPNTNWTVNVIEHTGSNPQDIEADPTADDNFAYDDDDTGSGSHDVIAAESPVIDLTSAQSAGENFIKVSGEYVYNKIDSDEYLAIEYWDADASAWTLFYQFPNQDTPNAPTDNFCSATPESYLSDALDISGFTASQLSGFKYRIIYNDDTTGGNGYNWGFCFSSPTIFSSSSNFSQPVFSLTEVPDCTNNQYSVDVEVTDLGGASSVTISDDQGSATQQLSAPGTVSFGPYTSGTSVNFTVMNDDDSNISESDTFVYFCPPANDDCDNAISLTVNSDLSCTTVTHGTTVGATASSQADDVTGTPDNDVWFSFVATDTSHSISLLNVTAVIGTNVDMGMGLYSGDCSNLTLVDDSDPNSMLVSGLTVGDTYYLRVYGWSSGSSSAQAEFDVCVGTLPPPPANDDCAHAATLNVDQDACVTPTVADNSSATDSGEAAPSCSSYQGGDLWYTVTVPASGHLFVETSSVQGSDVSDTGMAVYSGACGSLTEVACDDDSGTGNFSQIELTGQTPGDVLYVRVFEYGNNSFGQFNICAWDPEASSVQDNQIAGFQYYPNPVNNTLNMSAKDNIENVSIFNIAGQEVMRVQPETAQTQIDMSDLQNGVYFVKAQINGQTTAFKVVKK